VIAVDIDGPRGIVNGIRIDGVVSALAAEDAPFLPSYAKIASPGLPKRLQ